MDDDKITVAIELGSSRISGAAARRNPDGRLEVLACASVPSSGCIRHGAVYNLDRTADGIAEVVELLERQLNAKICQTFVGCGGKSLKSFPVVLERNLDEEAVVDTALVDEMLAECGDMPVDNMLSLCIASQKFRTDHKNAPEADPVGIACSHIEATFQMILIRPKLFKLLDDSFRHASLELADSFITPMALADIVLTDEEKQRGCALVDYGADTTTVSVYKGGQLEWLRVIPLGSDTITKDIEKQLKISHEQAESLKVGYGLCGCSGTEDETVPVGSGTISLKLLGDIIEARNEEIMTNILHQIKASGCHESLFGGMVVTGGGSSLKRLNTVMPAFFKGISPIRFCNEPLVQVKWRDSSGNEADAAHLSLLALLMKGDENCCEVAPVQDMTIEPTPQQQAGMVQGSLFDDDGESVQEKLDRELAERRKAEEEARKQQMKEKRKERTDSLMSKAMYAFHKFFDDVQ